MPTYAAINVVGHMRELWRFRELVHVLAVRNIKVKYQQSMLGFLWTLLNPLLMLAILLIVFTQIARIPIESYWAFLLSGYFVWNFINQTLTAGTFVLTEHSTMLRSVPFPGDIPVLAAALSRFVEFVIELALVVVLVAVFHHGKLPVSFAIVPLLTVFLMVLAMGLALPVAALAVYYYDVRHMMPIALTALFYVSPVFYSVELVPASFRFLYVVNPIAHLLEIYRLAIYDGVMPSAGTTVTVGAISVATFVLGYAVFNHFKSTFAEVV